MDPITTTPHNHRVVFGRKVQGCPRCTELRLGMPPRQWRGQRVYSSRIVDEIRAHDCKRSGCMSICTFGDY